MSLIIKFSQNIFKNKIKRKRNFVICHFLVRSIDYSKRECLPDKKSIPLVMKTCFSEEKLMKKFETPPL